MDNESIIGAFVQHGRFDSHAAGRERFGAAPARRGTGLDLRSRFCRYCAAASLCAPRPYHALALLAQTFAAIGHMAGNGGVETRFAAGAVPAGGGQPRLAEIGMVRALGECADYGAEPRIGTRIVGDALVSLHGGCAQRARCGVAQPNDFGAGLWLHNRQPARFRRADSRRCARQPAPARCLSCGGACHQPRCEIVAGGKLAGFVAQAARNRRLTGAAAVGQ